MAADPREESGSERELKPAIRRVPADERDDSERERAGRQSERGGSETETGNVAGSLDADQPLEPQQINVENAFFVLLGVVLVVGFLVLAIQGL